jgi:hypothetical protein
MKCSYCNKDPGVKENGLWKGFRDADTSQLVCFKCQAKHYQAKAKTEFANMYSEFPVQVVYQLELL